MRAINKGVVDMLKEPGRVSCRVAKREPLIKIAVERERFEATVKMK